MMQFVRVTPALDPELAATDHDYWFDHAEEDQLAQWERESQRVALFNRIQEMQNDSRYAD